MKVVIITNSSSRLQVDWKYDKDLFKKDRAQIVSNKLNPTKEQ